MTEHQRHTVTVPVGLGGKTTPYVPDPAPTLVVELPSVETTRELARIEGLTTEARAEADAILDAARSEASRIHDEATAAADEIRQTASQELAATRDEIAAERETLESSRKDLDIRTAALDDRELTLDTREAELTSDREALEARLARADEDIAEAGSVLADARTQAESVLQEAQSAADRIITEAMQQAEETAAQLVADARASADLEAMVSERLNEVESMHRIEVEVLRDREQELLERIAFLEKERSNQASPADVPAGEDRQTVGPAIDEIVDTPAADIGVVTVQLPDERKVGRHTGGEGPDPRDLSSHAPLTEQLSTSAFRSATERKGRRRR